MCVGHLVDNTHSCRHRDLREDAVCRSHLVHNPYVLLLDERVLKFMCVSVVGDTMVSPSGTTTHIQLPVREVGDDVCPAYR
jgi:hypothetical protein